MKTGRLRDLDMLVVESQPYTDDLPWSLQVPRLGPVAEERERSESLFSELWLRLQRRESDGVEEVYK